MTRSIADIQRVLKRAGFWDGPIDGNVTKEFTTAVAEAQTAIGTFADGLWGPATETLLDRYLAEKGL